MEFNNQSIVFAIFFLFLVYFLYSDLTKNENNISLENNYTDPDVQWIDEEFGYGFGKMTSKKSFKELTNKLGNPSVLDPRPNGFALWKKDKIESLPYRKIMIKDEQIIHSKPSDHVDFIYTFYHIDIPTEKIGYLHSISQSISYNPLKKMLKTSSYDLRINAVTNYIVKQYANNELTIDEAVGMYGPLVKEIVNDENKYKQLESQL